MSRRVCGAPIHDTSIERPTLPHIGATLYETVSTRWRRIDCKLEQAGPRHFDPRNAILCTMWSEPGLKGSLQAHSRIYPLQVRQ
jgi:hypothetical protein